MVPLMTEEIVESISDRYIELYEQITGEKFIKNPSENILNRIEENTKAAVEQLLQ